MFFVREDEEDSVLAPPRPHFARCLQQTKKYPRAVYTETTCGCRALQIQMIALFIEFETLFVLNLLWIRLYTPTTVFHPVQKFVFIIDIHFNSPGNIAVKQKP